MSAMQELNEAMLYRIMYEQFMNQVQVIQNIYGEYNRDTLSLLDDADYYERLARLSDVSMAYVSLSIEIIKTKDIITRVKARVDEAETAEDEVTVDIWQDELENCKRWLSLNEALFKQAQAQFALFRPLALVQAFEQKKKRGSILGTGKDIMNQLLGRKKREEKASESEEVKQLGDGLDPEKVLDEAIKEQMDAKEK